MRSFILFFSSLLIISCEKEEIAVNYTPAENLSLNEVTMGEFYETQIYYSLQKNEVVASNSRFNHDFRLVKTDDYVGVRLNSAKYMRAYPLSGEFEEVYTEDDNLYKVDRVGEFYDSTVIDLESNDLYLVDFGKSNNGSSFGVFKVYFEMQSNGLLVKYGALNDEIGEDLFVPFNTESGVQDFSMLQLNVVDNTPDKDDWDIKFTQYTDILEGHTPYLVTGVLINPFKVNCSEVKGEEYDSYNLNEVQNLSYVERRDVIGYNWKSYSFESSSYVIDEKNAYIINCADGVFRYLKFLGFYNSSGVKGSPSFEVRAY